MRWLLIALLLIAPAAWAQELTVDQKIVAEDARLQRKGREALSQKEKKQIRDQGWRHRRVGEFDPPASNFSRPSDWKGRRDRGTLEYNPSWTNYSFHKIRVSDGTIINCPGNRGNFTQRAPNTEAFIREPGYGHNLTIIGCNISNVKTYPDWTLIDVKNLQVDIVEDAEGISTTHFVARTSEEVPTLRVRTPGALQ